MATVAIIGAGIQGLNAAKNLLELNTPEALLFKPTILEARTDGLGGLWRFSNDPNVLTTLRSTVGNATRWRNSYSDFPMAEAWRMAEEREDPRVGPQTDGGTGPRRRVNGIPVYLRTDEQQMYIEMYAEKFGLAGLIEYGTKVHSITRNESTQKWKLRCTVHRTRDDGQKVTENGDMAEQEYDKVIIAMGAYDKPNIPSVDGMKLFKGNAIHSKAFKDPADFQGLNVVVVGFSNTAADIAGDLVGVAKKIYVSHHRGNNIITRVTKGEPADTVLTRRLFRIKAIITSFLPLQGTKFFDGVISGMMKKAIEQKGGYKEEWRFLPAPSMAAVSPMVSEDFIDHVRDGRLHSIHGLRRFGADGHSLELLDDTIVPDIDAVIFATGYGCTSTMDTPIEYRGTPSLPVLYFNVFHPDYPTSLATTSSWELPTSICDVSELSTMAIAQVFSGRYQLPPRPQMMKSIETFQANNRALAPLGFGQGTNPGRQTRAVFNNEPAMRDFLHDAAGTGLNDRLGWGLRGWWFWITNFKLCSLLLGGVNVPASYRLFADERTGRKTWPGALAEIESANEELRIFKERELRSTNKTD